MLCELSVYYTSVTVVIENSSTPKPNDNFGNRLLISISAMHLRWE